VLALHPYCGLFVERHFFLDFGAPSGFAAKVLYPSKLGTRSAVKAEPIACA
jgi:hypothetical protein